MWWDKRVRCWRAGVPPVVASDVVDEARNDVVCKQVVPASSTLKSSNAGTLHHRRTWREQTTRWTDQRRAAEYRCQVAAAQADKVGARRGTTGKWRVRWKGKKGAVLVAQFVDEAAARVYASRLPEELGARVYWHTI
jgi:hypothetical protein